MCLSLHLCLRKSLVRHQETDCGPQHSTLCLWLPVLYTWIVSSLALRLGAPDMLCFVLMDGEWLMVPYPQVAVCGAPGRRLGEEQYILTESQQLKDGAVPSQLDNPPAVCCCMQ